MNIAFYTMFMPENEKDKNIKNAHATKIYFEI